MRQHLSLSLCLLVLCICGAVQASAEPVFEISISSKKIPLNESVLFTVRAKWQRQEASYQFAMPELKPENLTVVREGESKESFGEDWVQKTFTYELNPLKKGRARIPGMKISYIDPALQKGGDFETEEYSLDVTGKPLPWQVWAGLSALSAALAAVFSALLILKNIKLRKAAAELAARPVPGQKLNALLKATRLETDSVSAVTLEFKSFLAETYRLSLLPSSTEEEILRQLSTAGLLSEELGRIKTLLQGLRGLNYSGAGDAWTRKDLQENITRFIESKQAAGTLN